MFDSTCTVCEKHFLIFPSQVLGLTNTDHGVVIDYVCWCGAEQTWSAHGPERRTPVAA